MKSFAPKSVLMWHFSAISVLILAQLVVIVSESLGHERLLGLSALFKMNNEQSIPAYFSSLALLAAGACAFAVAQKTAVDEYERRRWMIAAVIFIFLGVDEAVSIHEKINMIVREMSPDSRFRVYGIVIYILAAVAAVPFFFTWWLGQSAPVRALMAVAAAVFVGSAGGIDLIEVEWLFRGAGSDSGLSRGLLSLLEESGEMVGVALFLNAFLRRFVELGGGAIGVEIVAETRSESARTMQVLV
ncbi:hypothetical protein [Sphingobium yanoikuyae]|uniref:hypothetical protein n=1 Tax=Sphingobium yanoikuyae TaxID=13690 RepID=UPI0028AE14B9|nr:hypothetical protein [Sphingobium yanoikuyae]